MAEPASSTAKLFNTGVRTGGKVIIYMDGYPIAFAQSARFRDDYGLEPVHVIGQLQTIEYVPMHARHEITISLLVIRNSSLAKLGLEPSSAGSFGLLKAGGGATVLGDGFSEMDPPSKYYNAPDAIATGATVTDTPSPQYGSTTATTGGNVLLPGRKIVPMPNPSGRSQNIFRVLHGKVFDIEVKDSQIYSYDDAVTADGGTPSATATTFPRTILRYKDCFYAGGDVSIDANRVLMHNVTFYARDKDGANSALHS